MKLFGKILLPILVIFALLSLIILLATPIWEKYDVDKNILMGANVLFLITGILVFFMQQKALTNPNPNVFVRSIIAGMMIKMFSTVIAVLAYVLAVGNGYNKNAVLLSLFMYLIYLGAEVYAISKVNKQKNV